MAFQRRDVPGLRDAACGRGILALALLLLVPARVLGQMDPGRLVGIVRDAHGDALAGVSVAAHSPSLISAPTTVTDGDGHFRFAALASGTYALSFDLHGFKTLTRGNIVLAVGVTLTVNAVLEVAPTAEAVTVNGGAPVVDFESTTFGATFTAEKLAAIPSATDIWSVVGQTPGVRMLGFDVAGSHKSQQVGYESYGLRTQNRVVTEGVDTTEGTGAAGIYQDFFAHQEVSVSASAADVSMGTPGAAIVSTIKSGGNTFRSLTNLTYEPHRLVGSNVDARTSALGFTGQPNLLFWEAHVDLGGPVSVDKVWFYTAYNHFTVDKAVSGVPPPFTDLGVFNTYTVKGTWRPTARDTFVGYYQGNSKLKPNRGLSATIGPDSVLAQNSRSWMSNGQHQRVWTNRLFTEVKLGVYQLGWPMAPAVDFRMNPPRLDTGTQTQTGAGWLAGDVGGPFTLERSKPQGTLTVNYYQPGVAGSHDIKAGIESADDQSRVGNNGNSGPILYLDRNGATDEIRLTDLNTFATFGQDWTGPDNRNTRIAGFVQDRWTPRRGLTLTLGVRWDHQRSHYKAAIRKPQLTEIFSPQTVAAGSFLTSNLVVPRLGLAYDPGGRGRSVFKAFYGRYAFNFADRLGGANPAGTNRRDYKFLDLNGNRVYDGVQELGELVAAAGGTTTTIDRDLKTPYADEVSFAFERQFSGQSSFRVAYVRKMVRDDFATYNVLREGQFTVPLDLTVAIRNFGDAAVTNRTLTVYDIPDALRGRVQNVIANIPDAVGGGDGNFDTIQLWASKRVTNRVFAQGGIDYLWRDELRQNTASNSPLDSDPLGVDYFQNVYPSVSNRQDSTSWQAHLLGRYELPYSFGISGNWRLTSGWAWARLVSVPLPNAGTQVFFLDDINQRRSDTVAILDLRLDRTFKFARYGVTLIGDLLNATNANPVTNFNLTNGANFGRINATLDPRTAMLGARFAF